MVYTLKIMNMKTLLIATLAATLATVANGQPEPAYVSPVMRPVVASQTTSNALYLLGGSASGGSVTNLTPWTSDINAALHSLTNAGTISATNFSGPGTGLTGLAPGLTAWPFTSANTNVWSGTNRWSLGNRMQWFDDVSSGWTNTQLKAGEVAGAGLHSFYSNDVATVVINKGSGTITASNFVSSSGAYRTYYTNVPTSTLGGPATNVLVDPINGDSQTVSVTATNLFFTLASPDPLRGATLRLDFWVSNTCSVGWSGAGVYTNGVQTFTYAYNSNINCLMIDHPLPSNGTNYWRVYQLSN